MRWVELKFLDIMKTQMMRCFQFAAPWFQFKFSKRLPVQNVVLI